MSRIRSTLAAVAAAGVVATVAAAPPAGAQTAPSACPGVVGTIPKDKISFQLFNFLIPVFGAIPIGGGQYFPPNGTPNTPEQMQAALKDVLARMSAEGFAAFENFNGTFGWTDAEYRQVYESYGLHAVADHGAVATGTWDARLEQAQRLGLKYVGSGGWPTGTNMNTVAGAEQMGAVLNELGRKARAKNLWVYGHNHDAEFATKLSYDVDGDGVDELVPAIEVVMLNTDPSLVTFEIDVHWALHGLGYDKQADFVKWLRKYSKRISMLHVKGSNPATGAITDAGGPDDYTDWQSIFTAAADVDYYHWEYDLAPDPFASAKIASKLLHCITFGKVRDETGTVGGTVPATLSLTVGGAASFGAFTPGVTREYTASTSANVTSSAGDAALSVAEPGHLSNGAFTLPEPLQVAFSKSAWTGPISNDPVTVTFKQLVKATDALRTGTYSKTLTFTLSTTTP